jgi:hypothetical protein
VIAGASGSPGCASPSGSDQGVTSGQIKIAVTLINIVGPAGNATFGVPPVSQQQADYQEVIDAINASGGVACRKVVPQFYQGNPADQSNLQQDCLTIAQTGVFMELDAGAYYSDPALANCYPQNQIPFLSSTIMTTEQMNQYYPYLFADETMDVLYRNTVFALQQRGFFRPANGFQKLGFVYRDCVPQIVSNFLGWLHQVGLSSAQIVSYDVGCPSSGFASPSDLEQAIIKFKGAGVTNLTDANFYADFANFTTIAQQQGFDPKYGLADDAIVRITYGNQHPDYQNIANAIAIDADRYGEERTPGMTPTAATDRCNAIYTAHGQPTVWQQSLGFGGLVCDQLWMFKTAVERAPVLRRNALAAGLQAARSVDFSYPWGPNDFSKANVTYGGEFWRVDQFFTSCDCWRVIDPNYHPEFS